ncbi:MULTISPECIES: polyprenyl diphosphate synthase [Anaerotruncus]|uniref:polyprenyl diphosphate synthase n=1 Tax=Anaerotruncus TaxID=244127 RepID=UPI000833CD8C|nr:MULTISPECIES: polyprenyl diphosphate synthase [Anaerotruncus]RGX55594.1 di-trans,poly-cis-decaprenylcistransferase [Anaerotruncus sp. AF02-27]
MRIPKHIGIIPDGNRRWASGQGREKDEGYAFGLKPGLELLRLAKEAGVEEITYYGFTTDNCKRPAKQFAAFSKACVDAVQLIAQEGVSLLVCGNTESQNFPPILRKYTTRTEIAGGGIKLNFLVNYGWEWDLSALYDGKKNGKLIENLHSSDISRIDLVIRWGGMRRLSGFLPVQAVYADFYVVDSLWPDFTAQDFYDALNWYQKQDVTLGG